MRENEGVATQILLDRDADAERFATKPSGCSRARKPAPKRGHGQSAPRARQYAIDQAWLSELGTVLTGLAQEIRRELEREPDPEYLLVALACAPDTLAAQALRELGVDPAVLPGVIERVRARRAPAEEQLARQIEEVRQAKELAIESQEFQTAAHLRDQERELTQQACADAVIPTEVRQQIRRHLGISSRTDNSR